MTRNWRLSLLIVSLGLSGASCEEEPKRVLFVGEPEPFTFTSELLAEAPAAVPALTDAILISFIRPDFTCRHVRSIPRHASYHERFPRRIDPTKHAPLRAPPRKPPLRRKRQP